MTCYAKVLEKPTLESPIFIEGLPGIGLVANIAALHLIRTFRMRKMAELRTTGFQAFVIATKSGFLRPPAVEIYYHHGAPTDMVVLFGNAQAITFKAQYELCSKAIDLVLPYNPYLVVCMGGIRRDFYREPRGVFGVATSRRWVTKLLSHGVRLLGGHIYGAAGILMPLAKRKKLDAFCLLTETHGLPDPKAAKIVLEKLCEILDIKIPLRELELKARLADEYLEQLVKSLMEKKEKKAPPSLFI